MLRIDKLRERIFSLFRKLNCFQFPKEADLKQVILTYYFQPWLVNMTFPLL